MKNKMKNKMFDFAKRMLGEEKVDEKIIEFKLYEIDGHRFNLDADEANEVIQAIYDNVLKGRDGRWHLFYEGYFYSLLRVTESVVKDVIKYLDFLGVSYEDRGEWVDPDSTVQAWQDDIFEPLFHLFSEIGRREYYDPKDYNATFALIDRVIHCFLNHQYYALREYAGRHWSDWEARLLSEQALRRAIYMGNSDGVYEGYRIAQEEAHDEDQESEVQEEKD